MDFFRYTERTQVSENSYYQLRPDWSGTNAAILFVIRKKLNIFGKWDALSISTRNKISRFARNDKM